MNTHSSLVYLRRLNGTVLTLTWFSVEVDVECDCGPMVVVIQYAHLLPFTLQEHLPISVKVGGVGSLRRFEFSFLRRRAAFAPDPAAPFGSSVVSGSKGMPWPLSVEGAVHTDAFADAAVAFAAGIVVSPSGVL